MVKKFIFIGVLFYSIFSFLDVSAASLEERQNAVVETAYSYYYKGKMIQYDNSDFTRVSVKDKGFDVFSFRGSYMVPPEDATSQNTLFFVCSSFVYNVYKEAINYQLVGQPRQCVTKNMVALTGDIVVNRGDVTDSINVTDVMNQIKSILQPGDVLVYYSDKKRSGHAMLYVGNNTILHSFGYHFDWDNKQEKYEENGTIGEANLDVRLKTMLNTNYSDRYTILRPLNVASDDAYPITENATKRMQYPGLSIDKTSSVTELQAVDIGDEIEYTIKIKNNSSVPYTVSYQDQIPINTTYVAGLSNDFSIQQDGKIIGNLSLAGGEEKIVSYRVKVNQDSSLYGKDIVSGQTFVGGILAKTIKIPVDTVFTEEQLTLLRSGYSKYQRSSDMNEFLKSVYRDVGIDISSFRVKDIHKALFDTAKTSSNIDFYYLKQDDAQLTEEEQLIKKLHVHNMYAGTKTVVQYNSGVIKEVREDYLMDGDILISFTGNEEKTYLYLDHKLITMENGTLVEIADSNTINNILQTIIGEDFYTLLRPARYFRQSVSDIPSVTEENPNTADILIYYLFFAGCCIFGIVSSVIYFHNRRLKN